MKSRRLNRAHVRTTLIAAMALVAAAFALFGARATQAASLAQATDGKAIYTQRCAVCHGVNGDGNGPAADRMFPPPRDFTAGAFKVRTTSSDSPPGDDDLIRVISEGMPGTTMPAWKDVLSRGEIAAVAGYVKTFSTVFGAATPQAVPVGNRVNPDADSIARGAQVYQELQCFKCHGDEGRGDGPSALTLEDEFGHVIYPADLTQAWLFRGGGTPDDIYRRIMTGMTGSPMPSFAEALVDANGSPDEQKRWDLVNYVDSLSPDTPPDLPAALVARRVEGRLPDDADAPEWESAAPSYVPLVGQIMVEPRNFTPSIKGVWVRALHNDSELALLVQWNDRQQNVSAADEPMDTIAVQFPANPPDGDERPYFVFGDAHQPVNLWMWMAAADGPIEHTGRGADTIAPQATQHLSAVADYRAGRYSVVFRRALRTGDAEDIAFAPGKFIPVVFAASDGLRGEVLPSAAMSGWQQLYLEQPTPPVRYVWVPVAVVATAILETAVVWLVRRNAKHTADG